ncbi:hypothetical protein BpHYR1_038758 [Brachionus plicatilis]|uniref:Uncharacterized protein n=1 Tax=Brachionus plicatilis TaxID=10195 RepID=A0A3M7PH12_BRAPC|nr:hypothetical protein BpHYR1_038758 [Brachionus plicatilis]
METSGSNFLYKYKGVLMMLTIIKITKHFNDSNILSVDQDGFRTNHSCETALHEIISKMNEIQYASVR